MTHFDPLKSHTVQTKVRFGTTVARQNKSKVNHIAPDYIPIHNAGAPSRSHAVQPGGLSTPSRVDGVQPTSALQYRASSGGKPGNLVRPGHRAHSSDAGLCVIPSDRGPTSTSQDDTGPSGESETFVYLQRTARPLGTGLYKGYQPSSLSQDDASSQEEGERNDYFARRMLAPGMEHSTLYRGDQPTNWLSQAVSPSGEPEISHEHRRRLQGKGFCVLCFDGGGCRGYISLLILRHLLRQLEPDETKPIFPYLYFDLICGTSTGGLITILLAVLHLDIDTAINIYKALIVEVFADGFSVIRYLLTDAGYSRKPLKRAITKILQQYAKERDGEKVTQMEDPLHDRGCRGIVTTTHCVGEGRTVIALRSYTYPEGAKIPHHHNWTWDDAALATTAAPMFFKHHSITKDKHRFFFEDAGAHRTNNPTRFALEECRKLDDADPQLHATEDCLFISLGTGTRKGASDSKAAGFFGFFQTKQAIASAWAKHATNVNDVHESMQAAASVTNSGISYHRLNPPLSRKIAMGDWEELPAMENSVFCYCNQNPLAFKECADALELFQTAERKRPQHRPPPPASPSL